MSRAITLVRKGTVGKTKTGNYLLVVEATLAVEMPSEVFVFQRLIQSDNSFSDVFSAVATPVQLEDYPTKCPNEFSNYFRKDKIEIVGFSAEYIEQVWADIQSEVAMLVEDLNTLNDVAADEAVVIDGTTSVTQPMNTTSALFNFVNVPILDRPAGTPVKIGDVWTITNVDLSRVGWVPAGLSGVSTPPPQAKFFYNLPAALLSSGATYASLDNPGITTEEKADAKTLKENLPPSPLDYHFLYVNGVLQNKRSGFGGIYQITNDGVWWFEDTDGLQPWSSTLPNDWIPADWVTTKGSPDTRAIMQLNFSVSLVS